MHDDDKNALRTLASLIWKADGAVDGSYTEFVAQVVECLAEVDDVSSARRLLEELLAAWSDEETT